MYNSAVVYQNLIFIAVEGDNLDQAKVYAANSASLFRQLGLEEKAKESEQAIQMVLLAKLFGGLEKAEDSPEYFSNLQKADFYRSKGNWSKATPCYQKYLEEIERSSSDSLRRERARIQNLIGVTFIKQGKGDSALVYFLAALKYYQIMSDLESREMVGTLYNNLGSACKVAGQWDQAINWLEKSIEYNRTFGDSMVVFAYIYGHLCEVYVALEDYGQAIEYGEKSLAICRKHGRQERECQTLLALMAVYEKQANLKKYLALQKREKELDCNL